MKKSIILGMLSVGLSVASSVGQGVIMLDNYNTGGPNILHGAGSTGTAGNAVGAGWNVGLYYAPGSVLGMSAGNDLIGGPFVLGTGIGSTAAMSTSTFGTDGQFLAGAGFLIDPAGPAGGATFTVVLVAYNGASYADSLYRGHSAAFTIATSANTSSSPNAVGGFMQGFNVSIVPEPSTFALAGLGSAALLIFRRRKA